MTDSLTPARPGTAFWIVGVVALLWNLVGLYSFYTSTTATPERLSAHYNDEQIALIQATPAWAELTTGVAVIAGVLGSLLLLMRNKLAVPLFVLSLAAVIVQDIYIFGMTDSMALFGRTPLILQGIVLLVAIFLLWYARKQKALGVLK